MAAGAYAWALVSRHFAITPWLGLGIGGAAPALGLFTGAVTLRLRGLCLGLTTWFVAEVLRLIIASTPEYTRDVRGLAVEPFPALLGIRFARSNFLASYDVLCVLGAAMGLAMHALVSSRIGLAFAAIPKDELATQSLALQFAKCKLLNFTIASFLTGVLGAYYVNYLAILTPTPEEFGAPSP